MRDFKQTSPRDDDALIRACRAGDEQAWKLIVERYRRLIHSVPVVACRLPEADAEEIFQRVVVKLFENIGRLKSSGSLPAWLIAVTRNECRRYVRLARRWTDPVDENEPHGPRDDPPDVVGALHVIDCEHRLALAFERLDGPSRTLLSALYLEDPAPSYAEIASRLGRPIGSLGPTRSRCLKKLRRIYLELGGRENDTETLVRSGLVAHALHLQPARAGAL